MYGKTLSIRSRLSHQRRDKRLSQYRREAIQGIPRNTCEMEEGRELQKHICSVKVRRFDHPKLGHGKDHQVLQGVTGLEHPVTISHARLRKTHVQVEGMQ